MADTSVLSQAGALVNAQLFQTQLANCVMHLFDQAKLANPSPQTTLAQFMAAEATFDGYAPATIATWAAPVLAGLAWAIFAPVQTFRWTFSSGVGNMIAGYYLVDSSGNLKGYTLFNPAESAAGPGQAIIRTPTVVVPWG